LHLRQNKLSPESVHDEIKLEYPDIDGSTLKQLHIQYMQRYMMHHAPALFQYLETACKFKPTETLADIKSILSCQISAPEGWLLKHCLNKSKFWEKLKTVDGIKRQKTDNAEISVLPVKNLAQYVNRNPYDILSQLNSVIVKMTIENPDSKDLPKMVNLYQIIQYMVKAGDKDMVYGSTNVAKLHKQGVEAEKSIASWLGENGCGFYNENELKTQGYDKTPDFLLTVPIIVQFEDTDESDGEKEPDMLINWIESKSMFGDRENIVSHYKDQLEPYFQRFGPGIIIYEKGCIDEMRRDFSNQSIKVVVDFPKNIIKHSALEVDENDNKLKSMFLNKNEE